MQCKYKIKIAFFCNYNKHMWDYGN